MVVRSIEMYHSLLKAFFVYVAVRIVLAGILLVGAGRKISNVFGDSMVFGGGGGGVMAAFAMCLCIVLNPAKYKICKIYISILQISFFYYATINAFFLISNREGYFLLTLYAGLKYEIIFIGVVYVLICLFGLHKIENQEY